MNKRVFLKRSIFLVICLLVVSFSLFQWLNYDDSYISCVKADIEGKQITVCPENEGKIISTYVKEGDSVTKGQLLFSLDETFLYADQRLNQIKIKTLEERLSFLKKGLDEKMKLYLQSRKDLDIGALNKLALTEALTNLETAKNEYEQIETLLSLEKIEAEKIEQKLLQRKIYAPFDGIVTKSFLQSGSFVEKKDPVIDLFDSKTIWANAWISEKDMHKVKQGMTTIVKLNAYPDLLLEGKVEFISPSTQKINNDTLIPVKISVDASSLKNDYLICNGMSANIKIKTK